MAKRRPRSKWNPAHKHVRLSRELMECDAWRDLSSGARDVLLELMYRYNGQNNGSVVLSVRQAGARTNCTENTALKRLREIEEHGFVRCSRKGSFTTKGGHASEWTLTLFPLNGEPPTKDFLRWQKQNTVAKIQTVGRKNSHTGRRKRGRTVSKIATVVPFPKP